MTDAPATPTRPRTRIDTIADDFVEQAVSLSPLTATYLGIAGYDDQMDDFSPEGQARHAALRRKTLAALDGGEPTDDIDKVTLAAMRERLGLAQEIYESGLEEMTLNVIASPFQAVRDVFDLMPTKTEQDWATIASRMRAMPDALDSAMRSLHAAAGKGNVAPRRQVEAVIGQIRDHTAKDGYFATFLAGARAGEEDLPDAVKADLTHAVEAAAQAYQSIGQRLGDELLNQAPEADGCGRERYQLYSRDFLGMSVDLAETYQWGQAELARITAEMQQVAEQVKPGSTVKEAIAALDADEKYQLHGTDELKAWMQRTADQAVSDLSGTHFDIPEQVQRIEAMIAPTQSGGIYYTGPSEDFTRPGRMWWAVPKGVQDFGTWRELTTVYHEGVPGHHLQVGQTATRSSLLNRWRRLFAWTSGHGEGWALYAERLMADLGYLQDPGNRMGMLDGQSLRAARVVLDIGVHCGFEAPDEVGGGAWDYDKAWAFLCEHANMAQGFLRFELDRYLGWPGQAPSYKIGERVWMQLRDEVRAREGDAFDIKAFHRTALDVGGVGLDTLRQVLLRQL